MGSMSRYSSLERFDNEFGEKIKRHYEEQLLGLVITDISDLTFNWNISADISFNDGTILTSHFGWASEEEQGSAEETIEDGGLSIKEYFSQHLKDKEIIKITTGYERDDNHYAYAYVDKYSAIEIPVDFDPENGVLNDNSIISEEEFEQFLEKQVR